MEAPVTTYWKLDGGAQTVFMGTNYPESISDGSHTIDVWSADTAGNVQSSVNELGFTVDTTTPAIDGITCARGTTRARRLSH